MRLTVIGCSGSVPGPDSPASCYLVEAEGFALVLDLGNGALGTLQRVMPPHELGAIALSHLHPDHCLDMVSLAVQLRFGAGLPARPIPVLAHPTAAARLATAYDPAETPAMFDGLFEFVAARTSTFGPFTVRTARVNHPVPTVAIRVEQGGASLVYSGDTGESDALVELAHRADVLLCEAAWGGSDAARPDLHLTGAQAGEHAERAGVGRLLITHVPPWESASAAVTAADATFSRTVEAVRPLGVYEI